MILTMLKAKLHHAHVTHSELEYDGSCAIDSSLLDFAGIREYEQIQIYNLNNGERFTTYAIRAQADSGIISVNGAAARLAAPRDRVIICTYAQYDAAQMSHYRPQLVYLDQYNRIARSAQQTPVQAA